MLRICSPDAARTSRCLLLWFLCVVLVLFSCLHDLATGFKSIYVVHFCLHISTRFTVALVSNILTVLIRKICVGLRIVSSECLDCLLLFVFLCFCVVCCALFVLFVFVFLCFCLQTQDKTPHIKNTNKQNTQQHERYSFRSCVFATTAPGRRAGVWGGPAVPSGV